MATFTVTVTTSDGLTHAVTRPTLTQARKIAMIYVRTGFSEGDVYYTPYHTVKVVITS